MPVNLSDPYSVQWRHNYWWSYDVTDTLRVIFPVRIVCSLYTYILIYSIWRRMNLCGWMWVLIHLPVGCKREWCFSLTKDELLGVNSSSLKQFIARSPGNWCSFVLSDALIVSWPDYSEYIICYIYLQDIYKYVCSVLCADAIGSCLVARR